MHLFPAIDLLGGRCVRLLRGAFDAVTEYSTDPVEVAVGLAAAGARHIHVVDLDAARTGEAHNLPVVRRVAAAVDCFVQVGGGVRSREAAESLLEAGVDRVVVGTAAVERPSLVEELTARHPGRVAVGLDARGGRVAVRGWMEDGGHDLVELARRFDGAGVGALIVTSIERDGTMEGPDLAQLAGVLSATATDVVASGGVGTLHDLRALGELRAGRGLAGAIVGRALYEGRFTLEEALACLPSG